MTDDKSKKWSGEISLAPLSIKGTARSPEIKGSITCKDIAFKQTGLEARILPLNSTILLFNKIVQCKQELIYLYLIYNM
jgi:autotransporter translocation and assembly factor TamB